MADELFKISELPTADAFTEDDILTGLRDIAGTFSNKNFTSAQLADYVLAKSRKKITALTANITNGGKTLTDPFFSNTIEELVQNKQTLLRDDDFTQSGTAITLLDSGFFDGQKIIAKL